MKKDSIDLILQDLYMIDPELKLYEKDLKVVINKLLKNKPDTKFDALFAAELKKNLLEKVKAPSLERKPFPWIMMVYSTVGVAAVVVAVATSFTVGKNNLGNIAFKPETRFAFENQIIKNQRDEAFGPLVAPQSTSGGLGGGTGSATTSAIAPGGMVEGKIMPAYEPVYYKYTFEGDLHLPESTKLPVLKRIKGQAASSQLNSMLSGMNLGIADLSSFVGTTLRNFEVGQNSDFGYIVNVNMIEGSIFINQNWDYWKQHMPQCNDQSCYEQQRVKISDMPSDSSAIALAKQFVSEHKLNLSFYEEPVVEQSWRTMYEKSTDKTAVYLPEIITVTFPLIIEQQQVYDDYGTPYGLQVYINVKMNKVTGVGNLTTQNYNSSMYSVENDKAKLEKIISQGGLYGYYGDANAKTVEVKLGTPTLALEKVWIFTNSENSELLVPSLVFPVISAEGSDPSFSKKNVIIPLIKDIIDQQPSGPVLYQTK